MSIQNLKNRVIYSDNNEKSLLRVVREDRTSIEVFGLLTEIETIDTNSNNNLGRLAQEKLRELNRTRDEISLSMLGDHRISKGKLIDFTINRYRLRGVYLVTNAEHTIDDKKENVKVSIRRLNS